MGFRFLRLLFLILLAVVCAGIPVEAEEAELSAEDLAAKLGELFEDGDSATRLRLKIQPAAGGEEIVLQIQVKARRTAERTEVVYQVLWPKDRKGQAFLIQRDRGSAPKGVAYSPPKTITTLTKARMKDSLLGSDLAYQDVVENFFSWEKHSLTGKETLDRVECIILESKPGAKDSTLYSKVRSWIDPDKLVVRRVEKYDASGKLARKIDTARVARDDSKRYIPASLVIRRPDGSTVTEIEGSNIRHDVKFKDKDFTTSALNDFRIPR